VMLIVVCTLVNDRLVEPRLGSYAGDSPVPEQEGLSPEESRGLTFAALALLAFVAVISWLTFPEGAALRNPETGAIIGDSPFMSSLVFLIMLVFLVTGVAYGVGAKTMRTAEGMIDAITQTFADLAGLLFLFFVIGQFVAYFTYTNLGTVLAVTLADSLKEANLNSITLLMAFIFIGLLLSIPVPNILPKWAIMAPVFVPLFLKLGVDADVVLAAYRVSDSPPNVINPLLPHFALVVGFARRWNPDAGVGTVVAMMLPYTATTMVAWTLLFFVWYTIGLPFGPAE
jgi:aminobenzoyl-glutamate transport protein